MKENIQKLLQTVPWFEGLSNHALMQLSRHARILDVRFTPKDGVIGQATFGIAERFWVLRFRLMVKRGPCERPQASEGEAQHGAFCRTGSVKETSICIVDDTGRIVREAKVASELDALVQVLKDCIYRFKRIGLEARPLSQWLYSAFAEAGRSASIYRRTC